VGDNCVDWGFLDEGLASWSHSYYAEHYYSDWEYFQVPPLIDQVRTFYAQYHTGSTINQSNLVRPQLTSYVDYTQMPVILEKLRLTIGETAFPTGLSQFLKEKYFQIATLNDFQNALESSIGRDLDWFFRPWFNNPYLPDYAIRDATYDTMTSTLSFEIVDLNQDSNAYDYSQQVPVKVYNSAEDELVDAVVWVNGSTTVAFQTTGSPSEIRLDYSDYVIVQLPSAAITYYSTHQIEELSPFTLLLGPAVVLSILVATLLVYYLRKRRAG
jgi:aminopeptidase N